jgi:hypothetical protein
MHGSARLRPAGSIHPFHLQVGDLWVSWFFVPFAGIPVFSCGCPRLSPCRAHQDSTRGPGIADQADASDRGRAASMFRSEYRGLPATAGLDRPGICTGQAWPNPGGRSCDRRCGRPRRPPLDDPRCGLRRRLGARGGLRPGFVRVGRTSRPAMAERDSAGDPAQLRSDTGSIAARKGGFVVVEGFPHADFECMARRD